jgi:branched-subunit amino acid ABC-type transport system permease component
MTHFLLATLVASPLHARLSLLIMVIAELIVVDEAARATVNRANSPWTTPLPLQGTIGTLQAANAHRAGRA